METKLEAKTVPFFVRVANFYLSTVDYFYLTTYTYLRQLEATGRLVLCGPFGDGHGGMIVIRASSPEEARAIAVTDPFVAAGVEDFEVRTWQLSCEGNKHMGMGDQSSQGHDG